MYKYEDLFNLTGKRAVVIGGAGGIGQAIASGLATFGADVAIASRKLEGLQRAAAEIREESGKEIRIFQVDVSDEASIINLVEQTAAAFGTADILVNSQGLNKKFPSEEMPIDEWDAMFSVNVRGLFLACREYGKAMIAQRYGRIINIGSIGAKRNTAAGISTCYGATKGAVDSITAALAAGWGKYGITVNNVCPIMTNTPMMAKIFAERPQARDALAARVPLGRIGKVEDSVGIAVFLASQAGAFVSGQCIYPDGGVMTLQ